MCGKYALSGADRTSSSNLVDSASSICLSQRLSHACLSINKSIQCNCEWLIISVIIYLMVLATWITVVILELILEFLLRMGHAFGPPLSQEYPLNLSILLGGGKETNQDSPSKGD